jgi:uncharacterized repeat protein (TIGR02543 family)
MRRSIISGLMVIFVAFAVFAAFPAAKAKADTGDPIIITSQPSDFTGQVGETARFTVAAEGEGLSYQWQLKKGSSWADLSTGGATTTTLSVKLDLSKNGKIYRCVITDGEGNTAASDSAAIHIPEPEKELAIVTQPADYVGQVGDMAKFTIAAEGNGLTYQWQLKKGSSWADQTSGGARTATFSIKLEESRVGKTYRCIVSDNKGNSVISNTVQIKLSEPEIPLEITSQPTDFKGNEGDTAKFTVGAVGNGLTYQWQLKKGSSWANLTSGGATTATLSFKIDSGKFGKQYQCVITDKNGETAVSDTVTILKKAPTAQITLNAGNGVFENGTNTKVVEVEQGKVSFDAFEEPDIIGYAFTGWLYNGEPVNIYNVTSDMSLTADYVKIWLVTFDANGGTFEDGNGTTDRVTNPGYYSIDEGLVPVKSGYCFTGWKLGNQTAGKRILVNSSVTLVAQWVEGVQVTYLANGGSWVHGDVTEQSVSFMVPKGKYFVAWEDPWRDGYDFEGWKIYGGDWVGMINLTQDMVFEAQWKKDVKITVDPNGGGWFESVYDEETGEYVDIFNKNPREEHHDTGEDRFGYWRPDRGDDYEFLGWSTNKNATTAEEEFDFNYTDDVTFYAIWEKRAKYIYNAGEGFFGPEPDDQEQNPEGNPEQQEPEEINAKTKTEYIRNGEYYVIRNEIPWRKGYEFDTWVDAEGNVIGDVEVVASNAEDNMIYARWIKRSKITYDAGDGLFYDRENPEGFKSYDHEMRQGDTYEISGWRPDREGYEFGGWIGDDGVLYTEDRKTGHMPEITIGDKDYTFTAKWLKRVVITYNAGEGSFDDWDDRENEHTHYRDEIEGNRYEIDGWRPYRDGYDFDGWLDSENTLYSEDEETRRYPVITIGDEDIEFFAKWTKTITVTYNANGGHFDGYDPNNGETDQIHYRSGRVGEDFDIDGWRPDNGEKIFVGWSTSPYNYSPVPAGAKYSVDITLYAFWQDRAVITYHTSMGGWGRDDNDNLINTMVQNQHDGGDYDIDGWWPEEVDDAYRLIGYATTEGGEVVYTPGQHLDFVFEDMDLYAVFEKRPTVTYVVTEGGTFNDGSTSRTEVDDAGYHIYIRNEWPERDGYRFAGWVDADGNDLSGECILLEAGMELTVYTKWEAEDDETWYTVTYMPNGGTFGNVEDDFASWEQPADDNYDVGCWWPTREGYDFVGWSTDPNADPATASSTYKFKFDKDTTFYAVWERRTAFTLDAGEDGYFEEYAGEDEYGAPVFETSRYYNEYVITGTIYSANWIGISPRRDGYIFSGWTINGEDLVGEIDTSADATLIAKWTACYYVSVDCNGGAFEDGSTGNILDFCDGDIIISRWLGKPERDGYTFAGWAVNGQIVRSFEVTGNTAVTAVWVPDKA